MMLHLLLALSLQVPTVSNLEAAVVNIQRILDESTVGKAVTTQLRTLQTQKQKTINEKQAQLQQLSRSNALPALVQRAQVELQRLTEDAEAELAALDQQLQAEFAKKLRPIVAEIAEREHIRIILHYPQPIIVWTSPSIDVTGKVIERLDAEMKEKK